MSAGAKGKLKSVHCERRHCDRHADELCIPFLCITQGQSPIHVAVGSYAAVEALRPDDALVLRMQEALAAFLPLLFKVPRVQDTTCACTALFWDLATRVLFHGNQ